MADACIERQTVYKGRPHASSASSILVHGRSHARLHLIRPPSGSSNHRIRHLNRSISRSEPCCFHPPFNSSSSSYNFKSRIIWRPKAIVAFMMSLLLLLYPLVRYTNPAQAHLEPHNVAKGSVTNRISIDRSCSDGSRNVRFHLGTRSFLS